MISTLGVCEGFLWSSGRGACCFDFQRDSPLWRCTCRAGAEGMWGVGSWCKLHEPPLGGAVLLTEFSECWWPALCMGEVGCGVAQLSSPWNGEFTPSTLQEALTEKQTFTCLVSLASIRSLSLPCLCLSCQPARWHSTSVFYLRCVAWFKNYQLQILETWPMWTHADPLEEGSTIQQLVPVSIIAWILWWLEIMV